jgi:hypothetical protein
MAYRVTAGHVEVETGEDMTATRVPCGDLLPPDVSQDQIDWELKLGTIEKVPDAAGESDDDGAMPLGMSVSATLQWVGSDLARAREALAAEDDAVSPRPTLVARLETVLAAGEEGADEDPDAGTSVDS